MAISLYIYLYGYNAVLYFSNDLVSDVCHVRQQRAPKTICNSQTNQSQNHHRWQAFRALTGYVFIFLLCLLSVPDPRPLFSLAINLLHLTLRAAT